MNHELAASPYTLGVTLWDRQPFRLPGATCRQGFSPQALPDSRRNTRGGLPVLGYCPNLEQFHFPASTCKTDSCYLSAFYLYVMLSTPALFTFLAELSGVSIWQSSHYIKIGSVNAIKI